MKDFKKLIREAHLGNPLNEDRFKKNKDSYIRISEPSFRKDKNNPNFLSAYINYDMGPGVSIALGKETMAGQIRRLSSQEAIRQMEIIAKKLEDSFDLEDIDVTDLENGVVELFAVSDDFIDMDPRSELSMAMLGENQKFDHIARAEYGKPWKLLSIAQKQEMLSYMNKETEKEFETDYERRKKGDYSDDREDGMTDYQRRRMDENMGEWPKELTSRYSDEYRFELEKVSPTSQDKPGRAKYRLIDIESGELKGTPVFGTPESLMDFADDLVKKQGGTQSTNLGESLDEDINDPVLMKTRASQMKRDAIDSKRISAEEVIDLRYELTILDDEREDILMRIEDIGVEIDQTAEPEGGPIADELGGRLMTAEKDLRAINSKIIDIKDDLGDFDMNESDLDEGTCGYGEDGKIGDKPASPDMEEAIDLDIDDAHSGDAALDNAVARMGYNESLNKSLKEALNKRLGK